MYRGISSSASRWLIPVALGLFVALLGLVQPRTAGAASCVVTSTADSGDGTLRTFIIGVAINHARHHVRSRTRRHSATSPLSPNFSEAFTARSIATQAMTLEWVK